MALNTSLSAFFPFDFLHSEIVRYEKEQQAERERRRKEWADELQDERQLDVTVLSNQIKLVNDVFKQSNAETRLEALGCKVGYVLVEKIAKDMPRLNGELDKMKFICKEFWTAVFGKQVDNLRTNHQGVYVIQDNRFLTLINFSEGKQYIEHSAIYLAFPCGVVRGALKNLDIPCLVTSSVETLPAVKFQVHLQQTHRTPATNYFVQFQ